MARPKHCERCGRATRPDKLVVSPVTLFDWVCDMCYVTIEADLAPEATDDK